MIPSSKKTGKYEQHLFNHLKAYFEDRGFKVFSHVQLNLSWGNIISDIDIIAMSEKMLLGVEVKSSKDNLKNAIQQIDRMTDFFDGVYIASDKPQYLLEEKFADRRIGLLFIDKGVQIEKECEFLDGNPRHTTLMRLRKVCLQRLAKAVTGTCSGNKDDLASNILRGAENEHLRLILKSVVTCDRTCETGCPIYNFEREILIPLRRIQIILKKNQLFESKKSVPLLLAEEEKEDEPKS